jgi:Flp pilus assembly protein TadD
MTSTARFPVLLAALALASAACSSREAELSATRRAMARELMARGDHAAAFAAIDPVCRAHPKDAEALALRGVLYRDQGLPREARTDLEQAVKLAPDRAAAHSALAVLYDTGGDGARALEHHQTAAKLDPQNPAYLNNLGFALFAHGRAREAIPVLHEGLRSAPADARLRNNLGFAYAATGDLASAAEQFARGGPPAHARNNLGYAYERRGNAGQAFELYVEAVRLDPGSRTARENLARVARQLHRELPADVAAAPRG